MAEVTELKQTDGDQHFCTDCWSWYDGLSTDEKVVYIDDEEFVMPVDEFKVDDYTKTRRTGTCDNFQIIGLDYWDGPRIIDVVNGDDIYQCNDCEGLYPEREMAENCC